MKKVICPALFTLLTVGPWFVTGCLRSYSTPISAVANTPTVTPTPQTLTVTIASGSLGTYSGYYYSCAAGSNDTTTGVLSLTAHVGDMIFLPAANIHPLYFYNSSAVCVYNGVTTSPSTPYTFTSAGMHYFHCGIHATGCSPSISSCNATGCASLAGSVSVQ